MIGFQKLVQKSYRWLLGGFVAIMALSLVVSFSSFSGESVEGGSESAGKIFGTWKEETAKDGKKEKRYEGGTTVSKAQYQAAYRQAFGHLRWKQLNENLQYIQYFRQGWLRIEPKEPEIIKQAWEDMILLEEARRYGFTTSEEEVKQGISRFYTAFFGAEKSFDEQSYDLLCRDIFRVTPEEFEGMVQNDLVIDRLVDFMTGGSFLGYEEIYKKLLSDTKKIKVQAVSFKSEDLVRELRPIRDDEVAKVFERYKDKFKAAEKVVVDYLMADFEDFKARVSEPTEEDLKKYYEDNKGQFTRKKEEPPEHEEGEEAHDHENADPRPFEEVRVEVLDKIRLQRTKRMAYEVMSAINAEIGLLLKQKDPKEIKLEEIRDKYVQQGHAVRYEITPSFERRLLGEIEKSIGEKSALAAFGFDSKAKEYEIHSKVDQTTKGCLIYRLLKRKESFNPGLTEDARARITRLIRKEALQRLASRRASVMANEAKNKGLASVARRYGVPLLISRYFTMKGTEDTGFIDDELNRFLKGETVFGMPLGETRTHQEADDRQFVAYLEDAVAVPLENIETELSEMRRREIDRVRREARKKYIDEVVAGAAIQDLINKDKPAQPSPAEEPAPFEEEGN